MSSNLSRTATNKPSDKPGGTCNPNLGILFCLLFCLFLCCLSMSGQSTPLNAGYPAQSAYDSGQYDSINLQNLSVSLNVPIMSKAGAIPFSFGLTASVSGESLPSGSTTISPAIALAPLTPSVNGTLGVLGYTPSIAEYVQYGTSLCPSADGTGYTTGYWQWFVQLADGTVHWFPSTFEAYGPTSTCAGTYTSTTIDGSGYTLTLEANIALCPSSGVPIPFCVTVADRAGNTLGPNAIKDPQSTANDITWAPTTGTWTDSLGLTALTQSSGGNSWSWTDVNGGSPTASVTNTSYTERSTFGCTGLSDINNSGQSLPTAINFPDSTSLLLGWEPTVGYGSDRTGRLAQITLRDGASKINYNYNPNSSTNDGLNCTYQVPASMTRATSDGTTTYTWAAVNNGSGHWGNTTTKVDIGGNKTVYTFTGLTSTGNAASPTIQALTQVQYYVNTGTKSSPAYSSTATKTVLYCYNTNSSGCATAVVNAPVTEVDVYTAFGATGNAREQITYDAYGNVTADWKYDFGKTSATIGTVTSYGSWNGSSCVAVGSNVNNKPCEVYTTDGTNTLSESLFTYDSHGNLLKTQIYNGSAWLYNPTNNVYNSNGTISTAYDLSGNATTYAYSSSYYTSCGSCTQYPFTTSLTKGGLTTYAYWNGIGGVITETKDANGNATNYYYKNSSGIADPWWRLQYKTDPLSNTVYTVYTGATEVETQYAFNSGNSINYVYHWLDGYGREVNTQKWQGPGASYYDTVSTTYGFGGVNPTVNTSVPCSASGGATNTCSASNGTANTYDMLGRLLTSVDGGGGTLTDTWTQNDVVSKLSPYPSGENNKQVQKQYDGLGRLTSSCKIESSGGSSCNQATGSSSGVVTTTAYSTAAWSQTISSARGSETRSKTIDALGRVL